MAYVYFLKVTEKGNARAEYEAGNRLDLGVGVVGIRYGARGFGKVFHLRRRRQKNTEMAAWLLREAAAAASEDYGVRVMEEM